MSDIANRLRTAMKARRPGESQRVISVGAGLSESAVANILQGKSQNPEAPTLARLADYLDVDIDYLLDRQEEFRRIPSAQTAGIEIVGTIEAGVWREAWAIDDIKPRRLPILKDPRFPRARQYACQVAGDSMDIIVKSGAFALFVDLYDSGLVLAPGMLVHAERKSNGGSRVEATMKRLISGANGFILEPMSTNEKHKPIDTQDPDADEIAVMGIFLGLYQNFEIPPDSQF